MADLTALIAELDVVKASSETASAAVLSALGTLNATVTDLQAQIATLTAGAVSQAQIDALTATATDAQTVIDSITAAVAPPAPVA